MQFAYNKSTGKRVHDGDLVLDGTGQPWRFERVSRDAEGSSTGRVLVSRVCGDVDEYGECSHFWHHNGRQVSEYFPTVFSLYLTEHDTDTDAPQGATVINRGSW